MTRKQKEVLEYIQRYIEANGYSPSFQEISEVCQTNSKGGTSRILDRLIEDGWLRKRSHRARSLELVNDRANRPNLALYSMDELVAEIKRRGRVVGDIYRDEYGQRQFAPYGEAGPIEVASPDETIT